MIISVESERERKLTFHRILFFHSTEAGKLNQLWKQAGSELPGGAGGESQEAGEATGPVFSGASSAARGGTKGMKSSPAQLTKHHKSQAIKHKDMSSFQTHVALLLTKIRAVSGPNKNTLGTVKCSWSCPLGQTQL